MVLTWEMIIYLFVTQHKKQRKLHTLNHFACVGVIKITSAFVVVVLLLRLFSATRLKNAHSEKWIIFVMLGTFAGYEQEKITDKSV